MIAHASICARVWHEDEALDIIADPWGNEKAASSATTEIDREV